MNTDLIIIGAGAAGLMSAVLAGRAGLSCVLLEKRHRAGLKLLLTGNNRCNISHVGTADDMAAAYGETIGEFLRPALEHLPPRALRAWFEEAGLPLILNRNRVYPKSEKADDVLHTFIDKLRDLEVPLLLNCPVTGLGPAESGGFQVRCAKLTLEAKCVLVATGGVSYPKTGSVGDGQQFAKDLGLEVTPLRPGLVGIEVADAWLHSQADISIPDVRVTLTANGRPIAVTEGNVLCGGQCLRGSAIFDATRLAAHHHVTSFELTLDLTPHVFRNGAAKWRDLLRRAPERLPEAICRELGLGPAAVTGLSRAFGREVSSIEELAERLQTIRPTVIGLRPTKEAIVTVGGVALSEIHRETLEAKRLPGLFFAGEVLDIDGPTGGFNLHAAFATASLAMKAITARLQNRKPSQLDRKPSQNGRKASQFDRKPSRFDRKAPQSDRWSSYAPLQNILPRKGKS